LSTYSLLTKPTRRADRPHEWRARGVSAAEAATIARMSGSFSRSCDSVVDHLVSLPAVGEQRPYRAIDQPRDQRLLLGRAAEIAARNAACGVEFLLIVDGERQEIDASAAPWRATVASTGL
jgi:hypothetical protein